MKIRKQFLLLFISTSHLFVYAQNTEPSVFTKEANEQVVKSPRLITNKILKTLPVALSPR